MCSITSEHVLLGSPAGSFFGIYTLALCILAMGLLLANLLAIVQIPVKPEELSYGGS